MSALRFTCPHCRTSLRFPGPLPEDGRIQCSNCPRAFVVKAAPRRESFRPARPRRSRSYSSKRKPASIGTVLAIVAGAVAVGVVVFGILIIVRYLPERPSAAQLQQDVERLKPLKADQEEIKSFSLPVEVGGGYTIRVPPNYQQWKKEKVGDADGTSWKRSDQKEGSAAALAIIVTRSPPGKAKDALAACYKASATALFQSAGITVSPLSPEFVNVNNLYAQHIPYTGTFTAKQVPVRGSLMIYYDRDYMAVSLFLETDDDAGGISSEGYQAILSVSKK